MIAHVGVVLDAVAMLALVGMVTPSYFPDTSQHAQPVLSWRTLNPDFKMFIFVRQWPQGFCYAPSLNDADQTEKIPSVQLQLHDKECFIPEGVKGWTIHGLWPSYKKGYGPSFCDKEDFDEKTIESIEPEMKVVWPTLIKGGTNFEFWQHEWKKHGTCATVDTPTNSQFKYFNATLEVNTKLNVDSALSSRGIVPNDSRTYKGIDIIEALRAAFGVDVEISCALFKGIWILEAVEMCLDLSLRPIQCLEEKVHGNKIHCEEVLYPLTPKP